MCDVFLFAARSTSTAANSTHFPSGEGTGSPIRFSFIMSSKVKGCLPCENAGIDKKSEKRMTKRNVKRRITTSAEQKSVALSNADVGPDAFVRADEQSEPGLRKTPSAREASLRGGRMRPPLREFFEHRRHLRLCMVIAGATRGGNAIHQHPLRLIDATRVSKRLRSHKVSGSVIRVLTNQRVKLSKGFVNLSALGVLHG